MMIFFLVIIIWLIFLTFSQYQTSSHYKRLVSSTNKVTLMQVLEELLKSNKLHKQEITGLDLRLKELEENMPAVIQKIGLLRYNPFSDTGGDQSFVLAILDKKDNGVVLTSLHNRGITRWYAKSIIEGSGADYSLSDEEKLAIKKSVVLKKTGRF